LARTIDRCKDFRLKGLPESALSSESEDAIVFSGRGEVKEKILPEVFARRFAPRPSTESKIEQA
jgi:hypothetical protein